MPRPTLRLALGVIARKEPVVVANLSVFDPPPPVIELQPKSEVDEFQVSALEALLQLVSPAPPNLAAKRFEVEAVVAKKFVVVAEEPVAFTNVKF